MSPETESRAPAAPVDPFDAPPGAEPAPARARGGRRRRPHPLTRWAARAGLLMAVATTIAAVALKVQPPA